MEVYLLYNFMVSQAVYHLTLHCVYLIRHLKYGKQYLGESRDVVVIRLKYHRQQRKIQVSLHFIIQVRIVIQRVVGFCIAITQFLYHIQKTGFFFLHTVLE